MSRPKKPRIYRELIDELVLMCKDGQGQIGAERVREGVWHEHATEDFIPEQHQINMLLKRLTPAEREILARMLAEEVETGVFETLKALEQFEIKPFQDGYEGSPYNDFIGRLADWEWPKS
jgi:hypothetical protein